ncbi:MAG: hypothetical protein Satyrvirus14_15 [Satyrvirus sp.]|uniref:t-SNARE coiled-coil homology domain-containing protein n=1 Tax=Satyrvirus sp. TaxID=2487771 RepID=A0A3G5AIZ9_9VIRU|nr:MAG: hypothetical protein Satyrvirus14_15 [Satyrvirus sp.]
MSGRNIDEILQESSYNLKKAEYLVAESENIAIQTLIDLYEQKEILDNTDKKLTEIDKNQNVSNEQLNKMSGFWKYLLFLVSKIPLVGPTLVNSRLPMPFVQNNLFVDDKNQKPVEILIENPIVDCPILELSDACTPEQKEIYNKNEKSLQQLCGSIEKLSNTAKEMGDELDSQNKFLDNVCNHVDHTHTNMKFLTLKTKNLF